MRVYATASIHNQKQYLKRLFPVDWSPFISGSLSFSTVEEARLHMNCIYKNLFSYEGFTLDSLYSITFIGIENGKIEFEEQYLVRGM